MIEGVDLMGRNYRPVTQIVKAQDIAKIEVLDQFQPIKMLRGIKASDLIMLNVRLKDKDMLKPSGEVLVGGG